MPLEKKIVEDSMTQVWSGELLDIASPDPWKIYLEDLSRIGNICRFAGSTNGFYSVAEHCILMDELLRRASASHEMGLYALLHDAAEAYIGDIPWPVKWYLNHHCNGIIRNIESNWLHAIFMRFGLTERYLPNTVGLADIFMCHLEYKRFNRPALPGYEWEIEKVVKEPRFDSFDEDLEFLCLEPDEACSLWMAMVADRCNDIGGDVQKAYEQSHAPDWMLARKHEEE